MQKRKFKVKCQFYHLQLPEQAVIRDEKVNVLPPPEHYTTDALLIYALQVMSNASAILSEAISSKHQYLLNDSYYQTLKVSY